MIFRKDVEHCKECNYCCTLSMCTTRHGTTYMGSKSFPTAGYEKIGTPGAVFGFTTSTIQSLYKNYDFRCMKPDEPTTIYYKMEDYQKVR